MWWLKSLLVGAGGGFIGGLLGVGGGIIMVPLVMWLFRFPIHDAKATSLGIIVLVSVAGTIQHQRIGRLQPREWGIILAAGIAAAVLSVVGVALSEKIPRQVLRKAFACLMIVVGIKYLVQPASPTPPADQPAVTSSST